MAPCLYPTPAGLLRRPLVAFRHLLSAIRLRGGLHGSLVKGFLKLRQAGFRGLFRVLARESSRISYSDWVIAYGTLNEAKRQRLRALNDQLASRPRISIVVPVYDPPEEFLRAAIASVRSQIYLDWELLLVDDASRQPWVRNLLEEAVDADYRIKAHFRGENGHVARCSNDALAMATGEFVALLDQDDLLSEDALLWVVETLNRHPDADLVFSDEDKIDGWGVRFDPYFKPDYDPFLLLAQNMICHLGVYRTARVREVGGFREGFEGAQDWDLALRVIERSRRDRIHHITKVLYHWRAHAGSTALSMHFKAYAYEAGRRAVDEHLDRIGQKGAVEGAPEAPGFLRVRFERPKNPPGITLVIPTRDRLDYLEPCICSILEKSTYPNFEILIVDNESVEPETLVYLQHLPSDKLRLIRATGDFNFSRLNNLAVAQTASELLCFVNNDIEVLTPDWMEEMVSFAIQPQIGCVGARLWYPNETLQHAGVILGVGGVAGHAHRGLSRGDTGSFGRAVLHQEFSAVTGACLMVRREVYLAVGGFDETLAVAFNDIDFCLRVKQAGFQTVWTPYAELVHHESVSRGIEDRPEKIARFNLETSLMKARWGDVLMADPAYNPNLTLDFEDFSVASDPRRLPYPA